MKHNIRDMSEEEINKLLKAVDTFCLIECACVIPSSLISYDNKNNVTISCENIYELHCIEKMCKEHNIQYTTNQINRHSYNKYIYTRVCIPLQEIYNMEIVWKMQGNGSLFN